MSGPGGHTARSRATVQRDLHIWAKAGGFDGSHPAWGEERKRRAAPAARTRLKVAISHMTATNNPREKIHYSEPVKCLG